MSVVDIVILLISLIAIGALAGFLGGLFGMGGGVVLVPAFIAYLHWLSYDPVLALKQAVATSLFLVIPTGLGAVQRQVKLGNLDVKFCYKWVPYVLIGSVAGVFLSELIPTVAIKMIFMAYLLLCAIIMLLLDRRKRALMPAKINASSRQFGGAFIGAFSVILGIGGGTLAAPFLRFNRFSLKKALGLSSATTIAIGMVGAIGMILLGLGVEGRVPYSLGYLNLIAAVVIGPVMYFFSPLGVSFAHKLSKVVLNSGYIIFLMVVFGCMFWHAALHF